MPWTVEHGLKYIDLANYSGGAVASICNDDFASAITNVQGRILTMMTEWFFPRPPQEATIAVYINGQALAKSASNGWTYDSTRRSLKFHGSGIPPAGSKIKVDFVQEGF